MYYDLFKIPAPPNTPTRWQAVCTFLPTCKFCGSSRCVIMAGSLRPTLRVVPLLLLLEGALVAPMSIAAPTGGTRSFDVKFRRDGEEHTLRVPEGMPVLQVARLPTACRTPHL